VEPKDFIAIGGLAVSAVSAGLAYYAGQEARLANNQAAEVKNVLESKKFEADTSVRLLDLAYTSFRNAKEGNERRAACQYILRLGSFEKTMFNSGLIADLHLALVKGDEIDAECRQQGEDLIAATMSSEAVEAASATQQTTATTPEGPSTIGAWHAVIASYDVTQRGCDDAEADVSAFKSLLVSDQFVGATLGVYKTALSNVYAVSVDFGDDKTRARNAVQAIREIGAQRPTKEGADSFVQQNRGWSVDTACDEQAKL
jgi:hypothetical protein